MPGPQPAGSPAALSLHPRGQNRHRLIDRTAEALSRYLWDGRPELGARAEEQAVFIVRGGNRIGTARITQMVRAYSRLAGLQTVSPLDLARVYRYCSDAPEKRGHTETLFRQIQAGLHEAFVSDLYLREVESVTSPLLRYQLEGVVKVYGFPVLQLTRECAELAQEYLQAKAFTSKNYTDALHVAVAALSACDAIVSWNFQHFVRAWTMKLVADVHDRRGLSPLVICTPEEVISGV